ncbi:hypothetical protein BMS3Abin07_02571 [bacterium BMS3Abin07]|nr:hypothetical protein BMS3Abin07_02571 [bacterium BMS3Abin07]GBE32365.1 hypothetical protein BMS3Bbin05_01279 [bacterium BMS3Bbin05]HDL20557.1 TonB C-terminal domain-containing protein [Nitrospirota bacterium]HDO21362.1 TonB C-terminal domain-containing protein [Nitrospirota bacterium]HDZ88592.1 TonB C-terminal domain-containing protein [Nitrospirota bacterium]
MKLVNGLHYMILFSFLAHMGIIIISAVAISHKHPLYLPSSYRVEIITPSVRKTSVKKHGKAANKAKVTKNISKRKPAKSSKKGGLVPSKGDIKMLENRIAYIESRKKLEQIVKLQSIIDISVQKVTEKEETDTSSGNGNTGQITSNSKDNGGIVANYIGEVGRQIRSEWVYPEILGSDLEAIISIKIDLGGNIKILGIEQSSKDRLFDRSVMRAIEKASPVRKPPFEMEIGLRFHS